MGRTAGTRCASRCPTTDPECRRKSQTRSSTRSSPPSRRAPGWVSQWSARLSTPTTGASMYRPASIAERRSGSRCRCSVVTNRANDREIDEDMGRILIADDHDSLRRGLVQALSEGGHEVDEAPNGNAAIERLHEGPYDVVVSDLRMGGSTGIDVLKTAKTLHPSSAVILMTAFG